MHRHRNDGFSLEKKAAALALETERKERRKEGNMHAEELASLSLQKAALLREKEALMLEIEHEQARAACAVEEKEEARARYLNAEKEREELRGCVKECEERMEGMEAERASISGSVSSLSAALLELRQTHAGMQASKEARVTELECEGEDMRARLEECEGAGGGGEGGGGEQAGAAAGRGQGGEEEARGRARERRKSACRETGGAEG